MILIIILLVLTIIVLGSYFFQEKLIFSPEVLNPDYKFKFKLEFDEINYQVSKKVQINALHFKAKNSKGIVLYSHGNSGSLRTWGEIANIFINNNFDLLIYDYRGFGKSKGSLSEKSLYDDATFIYNQLMKEYKEENIIVYGRSIGTGIATNLASKFCPKQLVLESPYYNLEDLVQHIFPLVPSFFLRYKFKIDQMIANVKSPISIFHGTLDEVIYFGSCLKLRKHIKNEDIIIKLQEGHHNDLIDFDEYHNEMLKILS